jgi:hypothetical protein
MAQIIKHRRGSLESVAGATKRAGELLVVTGSSGITAVNGDSILFVGVDGSNVTPANKILQGTTVPNLTGASYDTSVDGVPFYDTDDQKLYILNKGGNVEVKATANTGGTGIISSSAQLPSGLVSESAQVEGIANSQLASSSISIDGTSVSLGGSVTTLQLGTSDSTALAGNTTTITSTQSGNITTNNGKVGYTDALVKTKLNAEAVLSGSLLSQLPSGLVSESAQVNADSITNFDANVKTKLNLDGAISTSAQITALGYSTTDNELTQEEVEDFAGALVATGGTKTGISVTYDDANGNIDFVVASQTANDFTNDLKSKLDNIEASADVTDAANVLANLPSGVISGSAQFTDSSGIISSSATVFGNISGDITIASNGTSAIASGVIVNDDINGSAAIAHSKINFDGSGLTSGSLNFGISGSTGNDVVQIGVNDLSFAGGTGVSSAVTDNTVTYSVQDSSTSVKGISSFSSTNFGVSSGNVSIKNGGVPAVSLNADVAGTGISLNGSDNSVEVDYGSSAGNSVEGNTTISVSGTANEIEITGTTAQALGGGATYTIGLPDSVTIATASIGEDLSVGGDLTVTGNLSVLGTQTIVDSTTVSLGDNILELNIGGAQSTAGLQVTDATAPNVVSGSLLWDGTSDYWKAGALGSEKEIALLNAAPTANRVLKADSNGLLVNSVLSDDGTDATFSGDLTVTGLSAGTNGAFLFADADEKLQSVNASTAGDVIQWNGSSFVASNEIDGGTF